MVKQKLIVHSGLISRLPLYECMYALNNMKFKNWDNTYIIILERCLKLNKHQIPNSEFLWLVSSAEWENYCSTIFKYIEYKLLLNIYISFVNWNIIVLKIILHNYIYLWIEM